MLRPKKSCIDLLRLVQSCPKKLHIMAFKSPAFQPLLKRPLGNHEIFLRDCHNKQNGAMNQICGLTLVTRHQIDEGMKKFYFYNFIHFL